MKKKTIGILLIIFFVMIISIGAISAADTNDTLLGQVSDTNIATPSVALEDNAPSLDSESGSDVEINVSDNQNELSNQKTGYKSSNLNNDLLSASNDDLLGGDPVTMYVGISGYCSEESTVVIFYDIMCEDDSDIDIETDYEFAVFVCDDVSYFGSFFYLDESEDMYGKDAYRAGVPLPYLAPGYHYFTYIYRGSSDNGAYSMEEQKKFLLAEGSQVVFTDFTPELTDGRIIMHYGDSKLVTFRAVSEKTGYGLKNVPFKIQIDDAPSNDVMTNNYGELSVLLENVPAAGDYTLKIRTADVDFPVEVDIPITVLATPAYLNVNTTSLDLEIDETGHIDAILLPSEAGDVTFASSDVDVVTIDSNGNYIAIGEGVANITVGYPGNGIYAAVEDVIIPVSVSRIKTNISIDDDSLELNIGDVDIIDAKLTPEDAGNITFTSSDEEVVTVDEDGNIVAVGEGEAEITLSFDGDEEKYEAPEDVVIMVTVSKIDVSIILNSEDSLELSVGDVSSIVAELDPEDAGDIIFTSSDEEVVTVDEDGNIVAVGEGEAQIILSFDGDDEIYDDADDVVITVTVSKIDVSIILNSEDSLELNVGDEDSIVAELDPEDAGVIIFTSSDEEVVTVDSEGNIKAVGEGEAQITLSFDGDGKYVAADDVVITVTVSKIDVSIILNSEDSLELSVGDEDSIVAELDPEDAGVITFTSSDESVVTVDADGNIKAVGEGEAQITLSFDGDGKYVAADDVVVKVNVSKIETSIDVNEDSFELFVGDEDSIVAVLDPEEAGDITFVSSDESVVTVDDEGNINATGEGEAEIIISFVGDNMYKSSETTVTVTVSKKKVRIELMSDDSLELNVGDEKTIIAYIIIDDGSEMIPFDLLDSLEYNAYTDDDDEDDEFDDGAEDIIEVDEDGNVKAVGEGEAIIIISFDGNDMYEAAEDVNVTVTVSMIETSITLNSEDSLELNVGDEDSIDAELDPEDAGVITFTSSDESVVTVDSEGNIKAVGEGEAEITLSFDGDERYVAADDVIVKVNVSKIETNIDVNEDSFELFVGDEDSIVAVLDPEEAGDITFVSSDESVVTVDDEGNINATGEGEAVISISFAGDNMYKSSETTVTVTVSKKNVRIELMSNDSLELNVGDEETIIAYIILDDGSEMIPFDLLDSLNYNTYSEGIVEVDEEGNVKAVGEGEDTIVISFAGNEFYNAAENITVAVSVSLIDTSIILNSEDSLELNVGDEDSIVAVLDPEDAGNVTFVSSDESVVIVDDFGNLIAVGEGEAEITLSFAGDGKYRAADNVTVIVTVSMIDTSIVLNSEDSLELNVGDDGSIVAVLDPEDAGNVTFVSSDESVVVVDDFGNLIAVGEGEANITLSFAGDEKYNAADNVTVTVSVSKIDTAIIVDDELELNVGDEDSIVAELDPEDAGNVTFVSSDESVVTVDSEGNVKAVGEGEANITLSFAGDDKYAASETVITVTVSKIDTNIIVDDELELNVGDEDSIVAELDPEDAGVITFVSSDESVVTVDSEGNIKAVGEGEANITLSFAGDDMYAPSEATVTITVSKIDTHIEIMGDDSLDLFVGDEDDITAFVVIDASGMIPITLLNSLNYVSSDDSVVTVDEDGNVKAVGEGEAVITVSFAGDDIYAASEDEIIPVYVSMKDAAVYAGPKSLDLYVGEDGEIYYFTIPEDLDVEITSSDESVVTVKNDDGFVIVTAVGGGNATVTLTVGDNVTHVINSTTVFVSVSKIATEIIADDLLILDVGDVTIIEFTTTPEDMNVTYESNDTSVAIVDENGIITAVSNGTALITLKIEEDAIYKASQATVMLVVYPEKEELNITVDADDIFFGEDAIILIWGLEDATGNITVTIDGIDYIAAIVDGMASFDIPDLDIGEYLIPINYSGDDKYAPINIYINLTVDGDKSDVITAPNVTKYYGNSDRFVVVVTDYKGNPVAGENVSFLVNNVTYTRNTDKDGLASIALNLPSGIYNITVTVDNKTTTSQVNILSTVNGTDVVKVFKNGTQYYATFRDGEGNYLKQGTTVRFNINGVIYDRQISGDKGLAKLNINLAQGQYIITAMNLVTGENTANKITVIPRLIESSDITKYYRNETQYTVKVINSDGTAVGAGVIVKFNINGVFYTRTTNESGIVRLNINLQPGDYIITAEYLDCKVSNKIKVLSVLSASDLSMKYRDGSKFTAKLVDGQGKAYARQTVTFNINGVLYNRQTDSSGQAKLNINLMAGEYIITSSYNGSSISNTITITA